MEAPKYKTALIVGAGAASAPRWRGCSRGRHQVALAARNTDKLARARAGRPAPRAFACEPRSPRRGRRLFGEVERELGAPDIVVYNASAVRADRSSNSIRREVAQAIAVSAFGGFLVAQQAARRMLPNGHGAILFTGASASVKGYPQSAPFAMGKFALRGLAQSMARELSPQGIHVAHFVIDGGIRSPRAARSRRTSRTRCSIPTRSRRAICTCCISRAAPGPGRWNCGRGSRSSEAVRPSFRDRPKDETRESPEIPGSVLRTAPE